MNKIRVIDLLNKIANGEEVPKKIKYLIYEYTYNDDDEEYQRNQNGTIYGLGEDRRLDIVLCDEVEIIEDSIIRLPNEVRQPNNFEEVVYITEDLVNKINEIIDYLEENK